MKYKNTLVVCILALVCITTETFCLNPTKKIQNGIQVSTKNQIVRIQFYSKNIVRVVKHLPTIHPDTCSLVVLTKVLPNLKISIKENNTTIDATSDALQVHIAKKDGTIEFNCCIVFFDRDFQIW